MGHARAKLTPFGRLLLVQRIQDLGWPPAQAAEACGVSRATAYKWLRRYRQEGLGGLEDRSSRPQRCPHALPSKSVAKILAARHKTAFGPHRLSYELGHPRSTIYAVLVRHGVSRLADTDRPSGAAIRYVRAAPGQLVHVDVKKLGRVPQGGGHRIHGRKERPDKRNRRLGYDYLHIAVDDASRLAYIEVRGDEKASSAARFVLGAARFFARQGLRIERVMTDNAFCYTQSRDFGAALDQIGAKHKVTAYWRPQTNGKVERFIRTLLEEWAYAKPYLSNGARLRALRRWLDFYNHRRPHTALEGLAPMDVVNNARGKHT